MLQHVNDPAFFPLFSSNLLVLSASTLFPGFLLSSCPRAGGPGGGRAALRRPSAGVWTDTQTCIRGKKKKNPTKQKASRSGSPPAEPLEVSVALLKLRQCRAPLPGAAPRQRPRDAVGARSCGRPRGRAGGVGPVPPRLCQPLLAGRGKAQPGMFRHAAVVLP